MMNNNKKKQKESNNNKKNSNKNKLLRALLLDFKSNVLKREKNLDQCDFIDLKNKNILNLHFIIYYYSLIYYSLNNFILL